MVSDVPGFQFWLFTSCGTSVSSSVKCSYLLLRFGGRLDDRMCITAVAHYRLSTNASYNYRATATTDCLQRAHSFNDHQLLLRPKREPRVGGSWPWRPIRATCRAQAATRDSPAERVSQQRQGALSTDAGNRSPPGTQSHSLSASGFRCKQLFGPAKEWRAGSSDGRGARYEHGLEGWDKGRPTPHPTAVPASPSPPPDSTGPDRPGGG